MRLPAAAAALSLPLVLGAQQPDIRVEVERVNVIVTVVDKSGRFITDLDRSNFEILEDGKRQEITNFARETDLPLQLALVMDTSASVRTQLEFEKQAATRFVQTVLRRQDDALLVEFDRGVQMLQDYTNRPNLLAKAIQQLRAGGGTALMDALYSVTRDKMGSGHARRVMVLLSDGVDEDSEKTRADVLRLAQQYGVVIYAIGTNRFTADQKKEGWNTLEKISEATGGRAIFPYSENTLDAAFSMIDEELRSQYMVAYRPTNAKRDGKFRKVRVKLKSVGGLHARHRAGYYAAGAE